MGLLILFLEKNFKCLEGKEFDEKKAELVANYEKEFANPYKAAELGYLDSVILPEETRQRLHEYLVALKNKKVELPKKKTREYSVMTDKRILILNRGEIASRIAKACRELNYTSVGVWTESEPHARHLEFCDEWVFLEGKRIKKLI